MIHGGAQVEMLARRSADSGRGGPSGLSRGASHAAQLGHGIRLQAGEKQWLMQEHTGRAFFRRVHVTCPFAQEVQESRAAMVTQER